MRERATPPANMRSCKLASLSGAMARVDSQHTQHLHQNEQKTDLHQNEQIVEEFPSSLDPRSPKYNEQYLLSFVDYIFAKYPKAYKEWTHHSQYHTASRISCEESFTGHSPRSSMSGASSPCYGNNGYGKSFSQSYPSILNSFSSQSSKGSSPPQGNSFLADSSSAATMGKRMPMEPASMPSIRPRSPKSMQDVRYHGQDRMMKRRRYSYHEEFEQGMDGHPYQSRSNVITCQGENTVQMVQPNSVHADQTHLRTYSTKSPNYPAPSLARYRVPATWSPEGVPAETAAGPMYPPSYSIGPSFSGVIKPVPRRPIVSSSRLNVVPPSMSSDNISSSNLPEVSPDPASRSASPERQDNAASTDQEQGQGKLSSGGQQKEKKELHCPYANCTAKFRSQFSLQRHHKRHTGSRPFQCTWVDEEKNEVCGMRFAEKSTLNRHIRSHTGEKPFACTFPGCHKVFADRMNWHRHSKKHS
eukprot:g28790.t1